jgi:predicted PurR-regulated permease PerM
LTLARRHEEPNAAMNDNPIRLSPSATFWLLSLALALLALLVFEAILLPFAAGFVLAYLFHPIVDRLNRIGVGRGAAAFAIIAVLALAVAIILALIVPPVLDQLSQLIDQLPGYYAKARAYVIQHYAHYLQPLQRQLGGAQTPGQQGQPDMQRQITQDLAPWLLTQLQNVLKGSLALFNSLALMFLTPVVTFFLLRDWNTMIASAEELLPRKDAPAIKEIAQEIDWTISGYLRGTLIVLLIVSGYYMVALGMIGLNYGLIIGLGAGLISFVPYLGSTGGFLVSGGVALAQFWPDYSMVALVCGVFVLGQVVEGNVLTPNIVGDKVRLHPVWMLFALIASGYLLGFTGLLISVPLAAAIGVLVRFGVRKYHGSQVYEGEEKHERKAETAGRQP